LIIKAKTKLLPYSIWKVKQVEHYFKRVSDTEWIETKNGIYWARFVFVKQNDDYVELFKVDGSFYLHLFANYSSLGLLGKWVD